MNTPRSSTATLIAALNIIARDIQSDDGVANAAIAEAAQRLEQLQSQNQKLHQLLQSIANTKMMEDMGMTGRLKKWIHDIVKDAPDRD